MSVQQIDWDLALIQKYNYSGPRYTSYPTALEFSEDFGEQAFLQAWRAILSVHYLSTYISRSAISFVTSAVAIRLLLASSTRPISIWTRWSKKSSIVHRCSSGVTSASCTGAAERDVS